VSCHGPSVDRHGIVELDALRTALRQPTLAVRNVSILGRGGGDVPTGVPEIAASTGSACHDGTSGPSSVLEAMGLSPEAARGAIRLSVGRFTTEAEIERAAVLLTTHGRQVGAAHNPNKEPV